MKATMRTALQAWWVIASVMLDAGTAVAGTMKAPAKAYGPDFSLPDRSPAPAVPSGAPVVTEYDLSLGCIVGGISGTGLSLAAGGINVVNLIAGGLVPAASPVAAYLALGGVVFASFCAVGQAVTPVVMASYAYLVPPSPPGAASAAAAQARYCEAALPLSAPGMAAEPRTPSAWRAAERM